MKKFASNDKPKLEVAEVEIERMEGFLDATQLENFRKVEKQAKARINFYWNTVNYVLGISFLILVYLFSCLVFGKFYHPWFIWPAAIWGGVIFYQFLQIYVCGKGSVE